MSGLRPLIERELKLAARGHPLVRSGWKALLMAILAAAVILCLLRFGGINTVWQMVVPGLSYCLVLGPMAFAEDRAAGGQSLLRLAGLGPGKVFWGSFVGSALRILEGPVMLVPLLLIGFRCIGTRPEVAVPLALLPVAGVLLAAAARAFGLTVARTKGGAAAVAVGAASLMLGVPLLLEWMLSSRVSPGVREALDYLSGWPAWRALKHGAAGRPVGSLVWQLGLRLLFWTVMFAGLAAWCFRRDWLAAEGASESTGAARWRRWLTGGPAWRTPLRTAWLDDRAYGWRLARERGWLLVPWALAAFVLALGLALAWVLPWPALVGLAMLYVAVLDGWAHVAASHSLAADRYDQALELLLTTPLTPTAIFGGVNAAVRALLRAARWPALVTWLGLLGLSVLQLSPEERASPLQWTAFVGVWCWPVAYLVALWFLKFDLPAWEAANMAAPFHRASPSSTPYLLTIASGLVLWGYGSPWDEAQRLIVALIGLVVVPIWFVIRTRFAQNCGIDPENLRTLAAAPLPAGDRGKGRKREDYRPLVPEGFQR